MLLTIVNTKISFYFFLIENINSFSSITYGSTVTGTKFEAGAALFAASLA